MNIALTAATAQEIQPLLDYLNRHYPSMYPQQYRLPKGNLYVWITGVGMMATTYRMSRWLVQMPVDWVFNMGIAGSYRRDWALGTVVQVTSEQIGDCGAEAADGSFSNIFEMGLTEPNEPPFINGKLYNPAADEFSFLPKAQGITVNKVTGTAASVEQMRQKYQPDIETMEGAAFHYACLMQHIPFLQIRAISNYVEPRNKAAWDIPLAVQKLNETGVEMLKQVFGF